MGNQIVTPSMGNWYHDMLRKFGIFPRGCIESGTFFLTLDCINQSHDQLVVKAYQYTSPLDSINSVHNSRLYFELLNSASIKGKGIAPYDSVFQSGNFAFLSRPRYEFTLRQRLQEYPPLEDIEKQWIGYRIIASVKVLHSVNLLHGSLNPDNVFLTWALDLSLSDVAPFKPSHIRCDCPHLFHHFFTTVSRGHCYLAPEQLVDPDRSSDKVLFNLGTFAMDLFSIGCVLYFLYTGIELFTFSELDQYRRDLLSIDDKLEAVPSTVRPLVRDLLSLEPAVRKAVVDHVHFYYPTSFSQISDQFLEFFHGHTGLDLLIRMIPTFRCSSNRLPQKSASFSRRCSAISCIRAAVSRTL
jgi:serine/threonine protein kinase